jgi:hypothetical protein
MMPAFIITGSSSIPAIWPGWSANTFSVTSRSLKGTTEVSPTISAGIPLEATALAGLWTGPSSSSGWYTDTCTESWWPW